MTPQAKTANWSSPLKDNYIKALQIEILWWIKSIIIPNQKTVGSIFVGGGTPSVLTSEYCQLLEPFKKYLEKHAEVTIEANPADVNISNLRTWKTAGFNRISLGVQSFQDRGLQTLTRTHSALQAIESTRTALSIFDNVNIDLIYGWNQQQIGEWIRDLELATSLNTNHLNEEIISNIKGQPVITTLARLEKRKGHINIINSIEKLKDQFKDIKYIIAGTGSELTYLKSAVAKKRLENNIIFLGNINESEKKYIFSIADLMVMPTLDESEVRSIEGFGIVYIESAFYGIPSIATNVGGTSEAVLNNVTGIVLNKISELDTVLQDLLTNKKKLFELGQKAKKRALEEFQWNTIIEEYISLISSIKIK